MHYRFSLIILIPIRRVRESIVIFVTVSSMALKDGQYKQKGGEKLSWTQALTVWKTPTEPINTGCQKHRD